MFKFLIIMSNTEITWDFSELYTKIDDPKITSDMEALMKKADDFEKKYHGKIKEPNFTASDLLHLFEEIEQFYIDKEELGLFAHNTFNANMTLPENKALMNKFENFDTTTSKKIAFLDLEIAKFVYENPELIENEILKEYSHYLKTLKREYPHKLSEVEEQVILEKDQFGVKEWSKLQSVWLNTRDYKVMVEAKEQILSYGDANSLLTHPDRDTRISANKSIYGLLGENHEIFSTALRNICGDWVKISERRKFDNPMHDSLIVNDLTQNVIENLMKTVIEDGVGVYRRYLKLKAKLLNLPKLSCADVVAPLIGVPHKEYSWEEALSLIFEALGRFDNEFVEYAKDMVDRKHIDAASRKGKRNGAYSAAWYKGKSAFILETFKGNLKEVYTLIHEMGHAIHDYYATRSQSYLNFHPGYCVAECASTFGELLMTDLLLKKSESNEEKMAVLAHVLDDAGQAAFQVSARYFFEHDLYKAIEKGEDLNGETIAKYWTAGRDKIYGDSIDWFEEMDWEWTMKGHYFIPNFRFYNYPYVFAQLFVYALYQTYKQEGKEFIPKFKKLLSSGGSRTPQELGALVGLDISKEDFWKLGIKQYKAFVDELENLM
jgi:oligoendopeptidase F